VRGQQEWSASLLSYISTGDRIPDSHRLQQHFAGFTSKVDAGEIKANDY
jgi:hypothetical protein